MLGMLRAESRAMADVLIQKQERFYDPLQWFQQLGVSKCTRLHSEVPSPEEEQETITFKPPESF